MAVKRMFSNKVLDTDAFLDMPLSAQALYFHLNLRADDDGFISNPKRIQTYVGASEDDLKLLVLKRFLIAFPDGVMVIKHWRMHNTIRKDRYTPTAYVEDLEMLGIKENSAYTLDGNQMAPNGIPTGSTGLGLDKGLGLDIEEEEQTPPREAIPYQAIINSFNSICTSFSKVTILSESRKKAIKARFNTYGEAGIIDAFKKAEASDFLKGKNAKNWSANFDWIMKEANMAKILDGNYTGSKESKDSKVHNFSERKYDYGELMNELKGGKK